MQPSPARLEPSAALSLAGAAVPEGKVRFDDVTSVSALAGPMLVR